MTYSCLLFDVNILGTIPDWCMVLVTTITAIYLYKTFQSQKEVQKTQTELYKIESLRFRESIKPILNYKVSEIKFHPSEKDKSILTIEVTNETDSLALEIFSVHNEKSSQIFIPMDFSSTRKHLKRGDKPILLHFLLKSKIINAIVFSLTYQDVAGTKYKQGVYCINDEQGTEINPFLPEIINPNI